MSDEIKSRPDDFPAGAAGATGGEPAAPAPAASEPAGPVAPVPGTETPAPPAVAAPPAPVPAPAPPPSDVASAPVTPAPASDAPEPQPEAPAAATPPAAAPVPVPAPPQPVVPPSAPVQPPVQMPTEPVTPSSAAPETLPEDWPQAGYNGPQPWTVSAPPALSHDRGFVASGAAGELVIELAAALAHLGYETSTSRGENPQGVYGESERQAVLRFRAEYNVEEDPAVIAVTTADTVGPWTWEALFRLIRRAQAQQAERG